MVRVARGFLLSLLLVWGLRRLYIRAHRHRFHGKLVLITGAASGIGRLLAIKLAQHGAHLALWDLNEQLLQQTAQECRAQIQKTKPNHSMELIEQAVQCWTVNVTDRQAVYRAAAEVEHNMAPLDILVNNAGIVTGKDFLHAQEDKMVRTMEVNVISHFWTAKAFIPGMLERNSGHIVTIASAAGLTGVAGLADYCASKFAAVGFADSVHFEMRKRGANIHSTVICPYYIKTGMFEGVQTRFSLLLPLLEPDSAANMIFKAIRDKDRMLCMPRLVYLSPLFKVLPSGLADWICEFLGINQTMDHFVGRK